jgi:hypothetical protein
MPNEWTTQGDARRGRGAYNSQPYKGRRTDSHKRSGGGRKPPKKGSGGSTGAMLLLPIGIIGSALLILLTVVGYLAHGYGLL